MLSPDRDVLREKLTAADIPSMSYYPVPLHLQPVFSFLGHNTGDFPVSERVANEGISLPMNPYLSDEEIHQVVRAFE
jgi:UDP-2-acetamido-2-deoxy-ribo-hexuluronate aminotransferase